MSLATALGLVLAAFCSMMLWLAFYAWRIRASLEADLVAELREHDQQQEERTRLARQRLRAALARPVTPAASSPADVTPPPPSPPTVESP